MAAAKKAKAKPDVAPAPAPAATFSPEESALRERALADPLFREARRRQQRGEAPFAHYDQAWDDHLAAKPAKPYQPDEDLASHLRSRWSDLLLEGEDARAKAGRPSLLTPELLAKIEALAETGAKDPIIYRKLGIRHQLWSDWTKDPDGELARTLARARATLAENVLRDLAMMPKGWQAGVWLLTQHFPELYSRPNADTQISVSATASAEASAKSGIVVTPEKLLDIQARTRRQLEKQVERARATGATGRPAYETASPAPHPAA